MTGERGESDGARQRVVEFTPEMFRERMGTSFHVEAAGGRIALRLIEVTDERTSGRFRAFSILFLGPVDRALGQGLYELHHDSLEPLAIFIVPVIGSGPEGMIYEACFNRPVAT
jgi:hypothetical protein